MYRLYEEGYTEYSYVMKDVNGLLVMKDYRIDHPAIAKICHDLTFSEYLFKYCPLDKKEKEIVSTFRDTMTLEVMTQLLPAKKEALLYLYSIWKDDDGVPFHYETIKHDDVKTFKLHNSVRSINDCGSDD